MKINVPDCRCDTQVPPTTHDSLRKKEYLLSYAISTQKSYSRNKIKTSKLVPLYTTLAVALK